ncbi:ATP-binding protein [Candidatus Woesearchaeota archaeon]|nr:ATP-binding protein [Candidatus Woesearchaeota archaeon]
MIHQELRTILLAQEDTFTDILGQHKTKYQLKSALLAGRHIIILGPPGIGKTTLAKNVARLLPSLELEEDGKKFKKKGIERFIRIQGSPDLTAEDLLGDIDPIKALKFGPLSQEAFVPGKIFKANHGILFFDELNRCPEKLQNALLQVLEEGKVTIGSYTVDFETNFVLIATMNPKDTNTEKLSQVLLDRFDMVYMGYPENVSVEQKIVRLKGEDLGIEFPEHLLHYALGFVHELRQNKNLEVIPSVRASLGLYERSQSNALLHKRNTVHFDDVKDAMESVIAHRIKLKPSVRFLSDPVQFVKENFTQYQDKKPYKQGTSEEHFEKEEGEKP